VYLERNRGGDERSGLVRLQRVKEGCLVGGRVGGLGGGGQEGDAKGELKAAVGNCMAMRMVPPALKGEKRGPS